MKSGFDMRLLLIGAAVVLALVAILFTVQQRKSPGYVKIIRDKDTGETIYDEPNKTPESALTGSKEVLVLGGEALLEAGMTQQQFTLTRDALVKYGSETLKKKYSVLKILPTGFQSSQNNISANLKLGESDKVVRLTVKYYDLYYVEVTIKDPAGDSTYNFDSNQVDINQPEIVEPPGE